MSRGFVVVSFVVKGAVVFISVEVSGNEVVGCLGELTIVDFDVIGWVVFSLVVVAVVSVVIFTFVVESAIFVVVDFVVEGSVAVVG